ncbi:50S ribosome-binding GTPase [Sediminihabitans luteus]|uniref:50S ribosome-binding GTPase n=1 Tax=Sediminihabitans luteus TaxID=1138585 RepID=A0A2M9CY46_9CELL|nr:GTPase domain-containing protein [Sediminihabitans luteus]PJJ76854.1 50S ribosome-binding GTPase [Sediminihabitans luteus]GIJ00333.1 hypothetical protein Slu03_27100 [Sediminihabitans luteus]
MTSQDVPSTGETTTDAPGAAAAPRATRRARRPETGDRAAVRGDADAAAASGDLGVTVHDVARDLRRAVAEVRFPLDVAGADEAASARDRLVIQLDEHLLPRLRELSSPALVVLAGSTGAGKSTLYNSILGEEVSTAGVLRPTTRRPVLAYNPLDQDVLAPGPATADARLVAHDAVPRGIAFVDAPDLDSLLDENRSTAESLLEAADLWLFATTAARYGDALPWQALGRARERGASVALVLNRVPRKNLVTIRADLLQRLKDHGMDNVPLFVVPDMGPHEGMLAPEHVTPITRWLSMLGGSERSRSVIVRTLKGSLAALPEWVTGIADAVDAQGAAARAIGALVDDTVPVATSAARAALRSGSLGEGPVASVWAHSVASTKVENVKVKDGVARSSRRRGRSREAALDEVRAELVASARRSLAAAGASTEDALRRALTAPDAPHAGVSVAPDPGDPRRDVARDALASAQVDAWLAHADDVVARLDGAAATAAVRATGARGLATVLAAAGAGNGDAARFATRLLGPVASGAVDEMREDLAARAATMAEAEAQDVRDALADPALDDDAGAGLTVRLAELRRLA